ncbi:cytochrome P450 [Actinocorallia sp. A-T 12471]|uniref:cytochrome P450 n=1 Tax=Actinocorallia sp. A-T 12471 TaxID=3089813 RepID=UPI0029CD30B0|nr:cytochrome P450 [Actinocorallia sp. A-T 12471]MDX6743847.1 cytochrome P450 [Actinocorallia sp. A-T 12471]
MRYDPFDPGFQADPYPAYRALRDGEPVHRHDEPHFWALSRFADIWAAVRDPVTWSSAQGLTFLPDEITMLGLAPTIVMLDPPRHTMLRRLVSAGFTPRRVGGMEEMLRAFVRERLTLMERKAADGVTPDLHRDYASPLPTFALAHLLGVPEADRAKFDPWVSALTTIQDTGLDLEDDAAVNAVAEMFEYFGAVITARRADPRDDLISALTAAEIEGERLTDWDILGFCFVMVAGGNDTTGNLISHAVMLLDGDHVQREMLVSDPMLIPGALMECLRLEGSVQALARTTTRPVVLHGVEIPEGEKVMMLYGSAGRDEREYGPTADRLDITRRIGRHLGFASGVHFCIGSHLAKLQARIALEELYRRHPHAGVDLTQAHRISSPFTRGWTTLPTTNIHPSLPTPTPPPRPTPRPPPHVPAPAPHHPRPPTLRTTPHPRHTSVTQTPSLAPQYAHSIHLAHRPALPPCHPRAPASLSNPRYHP